MKVNINKMKVSQAGGKKERKMRQNHFATL